MAENYKQFLELQYFDSQGMFISLIYSAPVLVNCVVILVSIERKSQHQLQYLTLQINWFIYSGNLLVEVKRKELLAATAKQSSEETKMRIRFSHLISSPYSIVGVLVICQIIETLLNELLCNLQIQ